MSYPRSSEWGAPPPAEEAPSYAVENARGEAYSDNWKLMHCHARIRLLTGYCTFLLKRAYYYRSEHRRAGLVAYVREQFQEMLDYKKQVVEIETRKVRCLRTRDAFELIEIGKLTDSLSRAINTRFLEIEAKVSEKVPGEPEANALQMSDEELEQMLDAEFELPRYW